MEGVLHNVKERKRRLYAVILLIIIVFNMIACSIKREGDSLQDSSGNKGRYVEKEVKLPEFEEKEEMLQIGKGEEGGLRIYSIVYSENHKKADIYQYDMMQNQEFRRTKAEWLQNLNIEEVDQEQGQYIYNAGETTYAYFNMLSDGVWINQIYKTVDGKTAEILPVKERENSKNNNQSTVTIGATLSGNLYMQTTTDLCIYEEVSKSFKSILDIQQYSHNPMFIGGKKIVLFGGDESNLETIEYVVWNEGEWEDEPQTFSVDPTFDVFGYVNTNNDIIAVDKEGIHQIVDKTSAVQTVVDGSMNMMYSITSYPKQIIQDERESFFVLYYLNYEDQYEVMEYSYDSEVATIPQTTLTVYSLSNDYWAREAATLFQREHPNVRVELRIAMEGNGAATKEDYIRQLNTELLNGEGPDVLIMDGLPIDSYISKDTLLDMQEVIQPLVDEGELLENVASVYKQEDGSYYTFPANITIPMLISHKEASSYATSLDKIVDYVKQYTDSTLFESQSFEQLMEEFLPIYTKLLIKNKVADVDLIEDFLTKLNVIYQNENYDEEAEKEKGTDNYYNMCKVIEGVKMAYIEGEGFLNDLPMGLAKVIDGSLCVIDQTFYPVSSLSINKNTKNKDFAKEFVTCVLSQKIQEKEMQTGFSVNLKALESRKNDKKKYESMQWTWDALDQSGNTVKIPYGWPDDETIDYYISLCKGVTNEGVKDEYLIDVFTTMSKDYVDGKESAADAAHKIVDKLMIYLKE